IDLAGLVVVALAERVAAFVQLLVGGDDLVGIVGGGRLAGLLAECIGELGHLVDSLILVAGQSRGGERRGDDESGGKTREHGNLLGRWVKAVNGPCPASVVRPIAEVQGSILPESDLRHLSSTLRPAVTFSAPAMRAKRCRPWRRASASTGFMSSRSVTRQAPFSRLPSMRPTTSSRQRIGSAK